MRNVAIASLVSLVLGAVFVACSSDSGGGSGNTGGATNTGGTLAGGAGGLGGTSASGGVGGGKGGTGGATGSYCKGNCGTPDPQQGPNGECFCDDACENPQNNDCCPDKIKECGGATGGTGGSTSGTCYKICCSNSDCPAGQTCKQYDPQVGTLGWCQGGATDGGTTDSGTGGAAGAGGTAGSGATDAATDATSTDSATPDAPPPTDGGIALPAGCVTSSSYKVECNPLTNAGCTSDKACDFGNGALQCFTGPNTQKPGETCDNSNGPWCEPTNTCK